MKKNKSIPIAIASVLCIVLAFSLFGCGNSKEEADSEITYPQAPISIIVPFAAGGGTDLLARAVAQYMDLGKPAAVQNLEGANTAIGTMEAYNSPADGHTLEVCAIEAFIGYYIGGSLEVAAHEEMEPIASLVYDANIVSVPKNSKFKSWQEIVDYAKANPGKLNWGSTGSKGSNEQASAEIWKQAGIEVNYVPYDSASKARTAAMGGHVDVLLCQISEGKTVLESGDLIGVGVCREERSSFFPDVPTFTEMGYDVDNGQHRAIWAPPGTPKEVLDILTAEMKKIYENPEFVKLCEEQLGYECQFDTGEDLQAVIAERFEIQSELYELIKK